MVPTSRSRAPVEAMRSGSRKPSPISTISPRLTTTSRPAASAVVARTSAAAPLLTTSTSSRRRDGLGAGRPAPRGRAGPARRSRRRTRRRRSPAAARQRLDGGRRQRGPAQVGVQHDAGRVEHRPQRRGAGRQRGDARPASTSSGRARRARAAVLGGADGGLDGGRPEPVAAPRSAAGRRAARRCAARAPGVVGHLPTLGRRRCRRPGPGVGAEADGNRTRQDRDARPSPVLKTGGTTRYPYASAGEHREAARSGAGRRTPGCMRSRDRDDRRAATSPVRLTQYAHGGGCACKIPPGELEEVVAGRSTGAGLRRTCWSGSTTVTTPPWCGSATAPAVVATADFFTPVVDDAYDWGRIAAANALSDVYAMGGRPLVAVNLVGWPRDVLPMELLGEVLRGGLDVARAGRLPRRPAGTASTTRSPSTAWRSPGWSTRTGCCATTPAAAGPAADAHQAARRRRAQQPAQGDRRGVRRTPWPGWPR